MLTFLLVYCFLLAKLLQDVAGIMPIIAGLDPLPDARVW